MSFTRARAKDLEAALKNLHFDEHWGKVFQKISESPFISSLKVNTTSFPSYIPSKNFSLAVMETIKNGKDEIPTPDKIRQLLNDPASPVQGDFKKVLTGLLDAAENNIEKFRTGIEKFYDDAMERAGGWYKKKIQQWLLVIGTIITIILNVDTVQIAKLLWADKASLAKAADMAVEYVSENKSSSLPVAVIDTTTGDTLYQRIVSQVNNIKQVNVKLQELPIPIGWNKANRVTYEKGEYCAFLTGAAVKLTGWAFTVVAIYLGAPFWFDLLNKFVNIRGTGKKPKQ
jgi:hypothetical protein